MPYFDFINKRTGDVVSCKRKFETRDSAPTSEEIGDALRCTEEEAQEFEKDEWYRDISRNTGLSQATGYIAGGKGVGTYNPGKNIKTRRW